MNKLHLPYLLLLNSLFLASCLLLYPAHPALLAINILAIAGLIYHWFHHQTREQLRLQRSLEAGLLSLQDGDFATSLPATDDPQTENTIQLFNRVSEKLRQERQYIYQRELLLDKVINASSTLTVLVNVREEVVFTNQAARTFFLDNQAHSASSWPELLSSRIPELNQATMRSAGVFVTMLDAEQQPQAWHLTCSTLKLHGQSHQLYLFQPMTEELSRRELKTWKNVVRVINHELNNSLAPISSMCHSGKLLAEKLDEPRLDKVFSTISKRVTHLSGFIRDYSQLARISTPVRTPITVYELLQNLSTIYQFRIVSLTGDTDIAADENQLEQVFINLLKNAHEAAPSGEITITLDQTADKLLRISVLDQGPGIPPELLPEVLIPGFSTKSNGSGIGLALCRDVIEAHDGRMYLYNHPEQGLEVAIFLPKA